MNIRVAVVNEMRSIRADRYHTSASSAMMSPKKVSLLLKMRLRSVGDSATSIAMKPVMTNAIAIQRYTWRKSDSCALRS